MIAQAAKGNDRNFIFISFPARLRPLHRRLQTVRQSGPEVYLTDIMDLPEFMDVWNSHFNESPCALTVVATKGLALLESKIEINIFGVRDSGKIKKQIIDHKASVAMRLGIFGYYAGLALVLIFQPYFPRRLVLDPESVAIVFVITVAICLAASTLGIRIALKVDPAEALASSG
jgi:hypothetical protein